MNSLDKRHVGDDFGLPREILSFHIIMIFRKNETKPCLPSCTRHPWKTVETLCCSFCPLEYLTFVFMCVDVDSRDCTSCKGICTFFSMCNFYIMPVHNLLPFWHTYHSGSLNWTCLLFCFPNACYSKTCAVLFLLLVLSNWPEWSSSASVALSVS